MALALFCAGYSVTSTLAATPYNMANATEGDPGDGVLEPMATEEISSSADTFDEGIVVGDQGYLLVPVFTNWTSSGIPTLRFLLIPRTEPGNGFVTGAAPWFPTFSGRGLSHAQ
jgi:hypothetical protein